MNDITQIQSSERPDCGVGRGAEKCVQAFLREQQGALPAARRGPAPGNMSCYDVNMTAIKEFLASL